MGGRWAYARRYWDESWWAMSDGTLREHEYAAFARQFALLPALEERIGLVAVPASG